MSKEVVEVKNEVIETEKGKWNMKKIGIIAGIACLSFTIGFGVAKTNADNTRAVNSTVAIQGTGLSSIEKKENLITNATSVYVMGKVMNDWLDVQAKYTGKYAPLSSNEISEIRSMLEGTGNMCANIVRDISTMNEIDDATYNQLRSQVVYMYELPHRYLVDVAGVESGNQPELTDEDVAFVYELVTQDRYSIERMDSSELKTYFNSIYTKRKEYKKIEAQTSTFKN